MLPDRLVETVSFLKYRAEVPPILLTTTGPHQVAAVVAEEAGVPGRGKLATMTSRVVVAGEIHTDQTGQPVVAVVWDKPGVPGVVADIRQQMVARLVSASVPVVRVARLVKQ